MEPTEGAAAAPPGAGATEPIRVVLADDDTLVRESLRYTLEDVPGIEVVGEAGDGAEALRLVRALRPDVLLLDLRMPGDGIAAARSLAEVIPEVRVVVLTGLVSEHHTRTLVRLGVRGYLAKSAPLEELVRALRAVRAGRTYFAPEVVGWLVPRPEAPTDRELEVLHLVAEGLPYREVAGRLQLSERTVHFHMENLRRKAGAVSRAELLRLARDRSWIG